VNGSSVNVREAVALAIGETLGDSYDCTRVWSAWGYGTMSENDFAPLWEDNERLHEIADAAIAAYIKATGATQ
jgi:hypothetical protein